MKVKRKRKADNRIQQLPMQMDMTIESGRLTAGYTRKENGKVDYDITVFRRPGNSKQVVHRFETADLADFARLAQRLAYEVSEDPAMDQDARGDLGCLAACLERVFPTGREFDGLHCSKDSPAWNALSQFLIDNSSLEEMSFRTSPRSDHPCRRLVRLDLWMQGIGPSEGFELPELNPTEIKDCFGGCPICGENHGYRNMGRAHWFHCRNHQVRWCAGENLFNTWRSEGVKDWTVTVQDIGDFRVVEPMFNPADSN